MVSEQLQPHLTLSKPRLVRARRWVFYISAIAFAIPVLFLSVIKESRPSQLLHRRVVLLQEATRPYFGFENPGRVSDLKTFVNTVLIRSLQAFLYRTDFLRNSLYERNCL